MAQDDAERRETGSDTGATQHQESKGTFVPLIFGGAVATALGFFGGQLEPVEEALGLSQGGDLEAVVQAQAQQITEQSEMIAALTEKVESIPEPEPVDFSDIEGQIAGVEEQITEQTSALGDISTRIETLEKRPMTEGLSEEAVAAYEAELARLQGAVEEQRTSLEEAAVAQRAEIAALLEEAKAREDVAAEKAQLAGARAAMAKIIAAVDTGEPFGDALADLQESGASVPEALVASAADGVPTLASLQDGFSGIARKALSAARAEQAAEEGGGLGSFLERQLGARSVTPQEGDDPDAVLSRVEASVKQGQINAALTEIDKLPATAKDAMADWLSAAQNRNAATEAANELMTALSTN